MATKEQFEFFQALFEAEESRSSILSDRAKWYLSLTALYSALIMFVAEKLRPENAFQLYIFFGSDAGMLGAFLVSLWAVRVTTFEGITDPSDALEQLRETKFDQTKFFLDRISDYSVAAQRNKRVNDRQALALSIAGYLTLVGMAAHGWYFYERLSQGALHGQEPAQVSSSGQQQVRQAAGVKGP